MKVKLVRKPFNIKEVDKWIDKYPTQEITSEKVIAMNKKQFKKFTSNFFEHCDFLPGCVEVHNEDDKLSLIVDSQGYKYARYVGRKVEQDFLIGDEVKIKSEVDWQDDDLAFDIDCLEYKIIDIEDNGLIRIEAQESDGEINGIEIDGESIRVHDTQINLYMLLINKKHLEKKGK